MPSEHRLFNSVCAPTTEFSSSGNYVNSPFWETGSKKEAFNLIAMNLRFLSFSFLFLMGFDAGCSFKISAFFGCCDAGKVGVSFF